MKLSVVILAAGLGKRMHSSLPKVLHHLAGKPLLQHVIDTAKMLNPEQIQVVIGHEASRVQEAFATEKITWVKQEKQQGTGHAVLQAIPQIPSSARVLILCGDVPCIQESTLKTFLQTVPADAVGVMTTMLDNPFGFGRVLRDKGGKIIQVVEERDANDDEKKIAEINTGIFCAPADFLAQALQKISNDNAQQEYYLPDILKVAIHEKKSVQACCMSEPMQFQGVNDRLQLATLERYYQYEQAKIFLQQGVSFADPHRFDLRGTLSVGRDVFIDANVLFEGKVTLGDNVSIEPNCILRNVTIASNVHIKANSVIEEAEIAEDCVIGPFARIRPQTVLKKGVHIGNFVEVKKSTIDENAKANHLSYIGDAIIGKKVNVGAGTITCNYDGVNKHQTTIKDGAFIGSNTALVAPVVIGEKATIGAGSVITRDTPDNQLTLSRVKQTSISTWKRKDKIS